MVPRGDGIEIMTSLTIFQDADRFIIGPKGQSCYSMTSGVFEAYSMKEARALLAEAQAMSAEELDENMRTFWTDARFEAACDAGRFGAEW
jgi:hypothetical protein